MLHDGFSVMCLESRPERSTIGRRALLNRKGQRGNVYQAHYLEKWNPQAPAYGRFWIDVQSGQRRRKTVSLGRCATQSVARLRLRDYIERAGINATSAFGQVPVPGTTFRQQAERWIDSVSIRKRRPVKPATVYGWQHCLDKRILPNLGNKLLSEMRNGALRQFAEILSAAGRAPKTVVNVVTVVKLVVASALDEEGEQIHPRVWNHEFIQLPLVIKDKQNRPTITDAEISATLSTLKGRDAVLVALVAGTGLRIGEALAVRTDDFDPLCRVLQVRRTVWRRREQAPKTLNAIRPVDIAECLAQALRGYTKGREGHLFTTRAGRLLDSRNVLDVLQRAGRRGGYHAFRRFRFAVLRKAGVPDDLIKLWLGHSQNLIDLYAAQLRYDEAYRREWCEKAGLGYALGELGYKWKAPIRPALVA
jgi:integrase